MQTRRLATLCLPLVAACGGRSPGGSGDDTAPSGPGSLCSSAPGTICTVAGVGDPTARGFNGDGLPARETMLYFPTDVVFDAEGRLVFPDFNNQRIRRLEHDGTIATIAGFGFHAYATLGAPAPESGFENPIDLEILDDGRMLVVELHAGRVIEIDSDDIVRGYAGTGVIGFDGDGGPATLASLSEFWGMALADDGTLYIADTENHRIRAVEAEPGPIEGFGSEGREIRTVAGTGEAGWADGDATSARFNYPEHMTWHNGALYIADTYNHVVRRFDPASNLVETVAGDGTHGFGGDGGPATEAQLNLPGGVAATPDGSLYIADRGNHLIRVVAPDGTIATAAGTFVLGDDGLPQGAYEGEDVPATEARLNLPENVVIGPEGDVWVADMANGAIRRIRR